MKMFLSLVILFITVLSQAEALQISGVLYEKGTRKILSDVNVFLLPSQSKTVTDSQGKFVFNLETAADVEIIINLTGYNKLALKENISQNKNLTLYLERESYQIFETTITGIKNKRDDAQKSLKPEDFLLAPGAGGDPVKAVQNLPGINRPSGGSANIIIQGSDQNDTGYLIGGHRVPLIFHFGGLSSVTYPESVGQVDYFSAGFGPELGRQIGGYVGLNLKSPTKEKWSGQAFMDVFNAGAMTEGPIDENSRFLIGGRYSYIGFILKKATEDNEAFQLTAAPSFADLTAVYEKDLSSSEQLKISIISSQDTLKLLLDEAPNEDSALRGNFFQRTEFFRIIPTYKKTVDENTQLQFSTAIGKDSILFDIGDNYFDLNSQVLTVRGEISRQFNPTLKSYAGFDNEYNWFDIGIRLPSIYSEGGVNNPIGSAESKQKSISGNDSQIGLYYRNEWKPSENSQFTFLPHIRFDRFKTTRENYLQPRFGVKFKFDDSLSIRSALGQYVQQAEPQESDRDFGNVDIKSPKANHYIIGANKDFRAGSNNGWIIDTSIFYKKLYDLVISDTETTYSNHGEGRIHGIELQGKYNIDSWNWILAYTFSQSFRNSPGEDEFPAEFDQTHNLNLISSYKKGNWVYGARLRYITGSPFTPITGSFYDANNDIYIPKRGEFFSERKGDFIQLDFRVDRKWIYDTYILSAYLDLQNLTSQKNEESLMYSYDYKESQKISGLPLIPSLGIKGEF